MPSPWARALPTQYRLCGDCWRIARPTEYEPDTLIDGDCDGCGWDTLFVHRVSKADVESVRAHIDAEWAEAARRQYVDSAWRERPQF